ncbi:hypothetical protein GIB67_025934 [Kingdonia uniflora]|uniref:Uncharacterized protein n=1 Tax=Kingdonia uniflora TaxID=39325 RepID=A0A7J7MIL5_9MAGN|nr:hypothetical protein GIB67_025934 [Kingdonia uniflora]
MLDIIFSTTSNHIIKALEVEVLEEITTYSNLYSGSNNLTHTRGELDQHLAGRSLTKQSTFYISKSFCLDTTSPALHVIFNTCLITVAQLDK